uniref:NADH-ubiquinone oxidoreductase chain 2 n=1 Tax=Illinigina sp. EMHAU-15062817 TaxID=2040461 RepID=A0A343KGJ9_9HEMI|nr:NADH dehydrogenase subunit 2 [Illinigina sp. EMHAU-15062817]
MKLNLSKMFFLSFMIIGVMMSLCSNNWLFIWCGMELSLITFLPLIESNLIISSESSIKYFLVQSFSSSILILGLMMMLMKINNYSFIVIFSILTKLGVAPFHLWVVSVVDGLNKNPMILMLTISKITPMMMLTMLGLSINWAVLITLLVGSIMGLNQTSTRKMLTYSSIFNMGLVILSLSNNFIWFFYLATYSVLISVLISLMYKMNTFYINQLMMSNSTIFNKMIIWTLLLSLGGMPPFIGFSIKLAVIELVLYKTMILNTVLIILMSLLVMFFYLRLTYMSLMFFSTSTKMMLMNMTKISLLISLINIFGLVLILTMKLFE